jgi:hypothetical protein
MHRFWNQPVVVMLTVLVMVVLEVVVLEVVVLEVVELEVVVHHDGEPVMLVVRNYVVDLTQKV